jgi:hypothetical protein
MSSPPPPTLETNQFFSGCWITECPVFLQTEGFPGKNNGIVSPTLSNSLDLERLSHQLEFGYKWYVWIDHI